MQNSVSVFLHCTVPYFGFKAKPCGIKSLTVHDCTVPYFGFKAKPIFPQRGAKTIVLCLILDSRQNKDYVERGEDAIVLCLILDSRQNLSFIVVRGGHIVLCLILDSRQNQYALRYCPQRIVLCLILDSRQNKYASGLMTQGGCPSLAAQFQTDFCQSFFNGAGGMKLYVQNMAPVAEVIPSMLR